MEKFELNNIDEKSPFIIAEISANHQQNKNSAIKLIDLAVESGADAVKFQTFTPDSITLNSDKEIFKLKDNNNWGGKSLYGLYSEGYTPYEWHQELFKYSYSKNIIPFSSVFSIQDLDFLESISCELYKIASYEANDLELVKEVASKGKTVFISIGGCSEKEVEAVIDILESNLDKNFVIFNCLSAYPAPLKEMSFGRITRLKEEFKIKTGFSDHSVDERSAIISYALGARFFEKHIMLEDEEPLDYEFSADKISFIKYVDTLHDVANSIENSRFEPQPSEMTNLIFKRSIFSTKNIKKGEVFTKQNTRSVRPSNGLHPSLYEDLLGSVCLMDVDINSPIEAKHYLS